MDGKGKIAIALGAIAVLLWGRKAMAKQIVEMQLSPHFKLSEFLRSTAIPEVKYYRPNEQEIENLKFLVNEILEPLRQDFGPIRIVGGVRPNSVRDSQGRNFTEALKARGYEPSPEGDHTTFNGADIQLVRAPFRLDTYKRAVEVLKRNPKVRQVILYIKTDELTKRPYASHIHVASVAPGRPSFYATAPDRYAFVNLDGHRVPEGVA